MKIFAVHNTFQPSDNNKSLPAPFIEHAPIIYELPDTALLKDGRPFFVPDYADPCSYQMSLVVRICRLGRSISRRFAHRYYDAATVGVAFTADNLYEECRTNGLPWDISKGFDNAAVIGDFLTLDRDSALLDQQFRLEENGIQVQSSTMERANYSIDEIIAYISQFYMLRQGDLLYWGFPCTSNIAQIDTHIEAYLGDRKVLAFNIK